MKKDPDAANKVKLTWLFVDVKDGINLNHNKVKLIYGRMYICCPWSVAYTSTWQHGKNKVELIYGSM